MNTLITHTSKTHSRLSAALLLFIFVMVGFNAYFTFMGAELVFNGNIVVAGGLAFAIQAGIGLSLSALPHVEGIKKLFLLVAYGVALLLSLAFAYTFVFQEKTAGEFAQRERLHFAEKLASAVGSRLATRKEDLDTSRLKLAEMARSLEEEKVRGMRSGRGPGQGPVYFRKLELLEQKRAELEIERENLAASDSRGALLIASLQGDFDPAGVLIEAKALLTGLGLSPAEVETLVDIDAAALNRNPVDRAIDSIRHFSLDSGNILISILIAVIFDLLALLFGIVRYLLLARNYSLLDGLYDGIMRGLRFVYRMGDIVNHARAIHERERAANTVRITEGEAKSFFVAIFSKMAIFDDSADPESHRHYPAILKYLFSLIQPLHLEKRPQARGIWHAVFEEGNGGKGVEAYQPDLFRPTYLKPLVGELMSRNVFENDLEHACYIYNEGSNAVHFIDILNKMSLQSAESLDRLLSEGVKKGPLLLEGRAL